MSVEDPRRPPASSSNSQASGSNTQNHEGEGSTHQASGSSVTVNEHTLVNGILPASVPLTNGILPTNEDHEANGAQQMDGFEEDNNFQVSNTPQQTCQLSSGHDNSNDPGNVNGPGPDHNGCPECDVRV